MTNRADDNWKMFQESQEQVNQLRARVAQLEQENETLKREAGQ